ncbi:hypothetical protein ACFQO4_12000 [Saliphagus sp. GCM10025334]
MRRRTLLLVSAFVLVPLVLLVVLGAVPSLIGGGDVYYVVASEVDLEDGEPPEENVTGTIAAENLSENRFPYTTGALEDGRSAAYEEGRFGFESAFTHTPFDEFSEFETWNRAATDPEADVVYLEQNGTYYRLEITPASDVDGP